MQQRCKHALSTIERLCFLCGPSSEEPSFETPACVDMSFGAEELN
jgi:hypothetical protein